MIAFSGHLTHLHYHGTVAPGASLDLTPTTVIRFLNSITPLSREGLWHWDQISIPILIPRDPPNTAGCPLLCDIAADHCIATKRHSEPSITAVFKLKSETTC